MEEIINLFVLLFVIFFPTLPFIIYNRDKIRVTKIQTYLWSGIALIVDFLILLLLGAKREYYDLIVYNILFSTFINYFYCFGKSKIINNRKLPIFIYILVLFFISSLFQIIPIVIFNLDSKNLLDAQKLYLTTFSDFILFLILILIYFKDLKNEFVIFKKKFKDNIDIGVKYWLLGLIIMMVSNFIILLFLPEAEAVNEQGVQQLISSSKIFSIFAIGIIAPIVEELVFRKSFKDFFKNDWVFVFASGLIFGGLHVLLSLHSIWDLFYLIPYSSLGLAFAYMYKKTDSIYTSMIMHMFHNTVFSTLSVIGIGVILL